MIGACYHAITIVSIWNHYTYRDNHTLMGFLFILDCALIVLMFLFTSWNWFLACAGLSTIEFIGQTSGNTENTFDYSFSSVKDNLFKVFGTQSMWAIFSPSLRDCQFTGLEWSFLMKDLGFDEYGVLVGENDIELELTNSSQQDKEINE